MSIIIKRTSYVTTVVELSEVDLFRLKNDLNAQEYLEEMDEFHTLEELAQLINTDSNAASLVFEILINSPGYSTPTESYSDSSDYSVSN
jgi:hypothetical protein